MATKKAEVKKTETKKVETKNCECKNCTCNENENYLKYIFYTLVSILVCVLIATVFIIIIAVDNNETRTYSTSGNNTTTQTGTTNNGGTEIAEYDTSMFEEITVDQFKELYNGSEKSVIYIGRAGCGYCVKFLPVLQQAQKEFGYTTYYYDIDNISEEDYNTIVGLNDYLYENFGYTPMVLVVQNGKIVSADDSGEGWIGYNEYDAFKEYLEKLGYKTK